MKRIILCLVFVIPLAVTSAQTPVMVQDLTSGSSEPIHPIVYNNKLYFFADTFNTAIIKNWLWSYDEKTPISVIPASVNYIHDGPGFSAILNGKLYISYQNRPAGGGPSLPPAIFAYDGINPMYPAPGLSHDTFLLLPQYITTAGNKLYFGASKIPSKNELWCYDGSNAATKINIAPAAGQGAMPYYLTEHNGKLYFGANTTGNSTEKLQVLDPTNNSFSIITSAAYPSGVNIPIGLLSARGKLYFLSDSDTAGSELYSYDGSMIKRLSNVAVGINKSGASGPLCLYGEDIYFNGTTDGTNFQLYKCNTFTDAISLAAVVDTTGSADINAMIVYKNKLYFTANTPGYGYELWRYDGQKATMVADVNPGPANGVDYGAYPRNYFAVYNTHLYFTGDDGTHGWELFRLNDPTGVIEKASWPGEVVAYPNPAKDVVHLSITIPSAQRLGITITDMRGRQVYTGGVSEYSAGKHVVSIPMTNFAAGQYFYRLSDGDGRMVASGAVVKE